MILSRNEVKEMIRCADLLSVWPKTPFQNGVDRLANLNFDFCEFDL